MSLVFNMLSMLGHKFSSKEKVTSNFIAAVTTCRDLGAPTDRVCHFFHCFPIYLPPGDGTRSHDLILSNVEF